MSTWFLKHRILARVAVSILGAAVIEGLLVLYYLNSWLTLPL